MPPLPLQPLLRRRSEASGKTFSIIFAIIALLVIIICLVWGFVLPRLRRKSDIGSLDRGGGTTTSGNNDDYHFPSHPALLRGFHNKSGPTLCRYNPRTESPFPSTDPLQKNAAPFTIPGSVSNSDYGPSSSHGLFSPTKGCVQPRQGIMLSQNETSEPQGKAKGMKEVEMTGFERDQDYILPVPEPLVLKPRPAGRPPPLTRQLEKFPMPIGTLKRKDGLLHPAKLFQGMDSRDSQSTVDTLGTPCPTPFLLRRLNLSRENSEGTNDRKDKEKIDPIEPGRATSDPIPDNKSDRTVRLRSRSQEQTWIVTTSRERPTLQRAGTVTRPRTPVAEMRERFNQTSTVPTNSRASVKEGCTPSVNPFDTPGDSSTPPTSPRYSDEAMAPPQLIFPGHPTYPEAQATDTKRKGHGPSPRYSTVLRSPGKHTAVQKPLSKLKIGSESTSKHVKPARLNLTLFSNIRGRERHAKGHSLSSLSTILRPIMISRSHQSHGASSIYSRDTKGMSFLGTPAHDEFLHHAVQPSSCIDERNVMLINNVKSKIDEWDLHTADLDVSAFTSTRLKRTLSDYGPRGPNAGDCAGLNLVQPLRINRPSCQNAEDSGPRMQIGRSSLEIFSKRLDDYGSDRREHATHSALAGDNQIIKRDEMKRGMGTAPGGVAWI
jgi:hypothetical protein